MSMAKKVMGKFYREAEGDPARLPWHRDEPTALLAAAVEARGGRGRALDVGCGSGVLAAWLADRGMEVTAVDLLPEAIEMAQTQVGDRGIELLATDLLTYTPERPFDVVYDSGCLHSLVGGSLPAYKERLLAWLAPGGDFVLEHWGKRHALDWRPIGPRRRTPATIERLFRPELELLDTEVVDFEAPLPFGPKVRGVGYRFRRGSSA